MNRDTIIRTALGVSTIYNTVCAFLLAFPASMPSQLVGLPANVPLSYRILASLFVLIWAGAYAWLATQPEPCRPMIGFAAVGRTIVFFGVLGIWLIGEIPLILVAVAGGELVFAALFAWWLLGGQEAGLQAVPASQGRRLEPR